MQHSLSSTCNVYVFLFTGLIALIIVRNVKSGIVLFVYDCLSSSMHREWW